ncbi:MAG: antitoxin Xre/MbcA/ParS toxin-binding domain-containing protein [Pseudomonas sp.]|uniref:antitoxin Xre/MbcA/ParS toxin-binding domain-containing protein n=1 Tax=Pseudomonas sp. TaxID=306 RepID=UPI0033998418
MTPLNQAKARDDFSEDARRDLARVISALFDRWQLDTELQMHLLGMSPKSRKQLPKYRSGELALPGNRDTLDRSGYLLGIHKGLRLLFPEDEELRFTWVHRRNQALEGATPLEVMVRDGLLGIARIARLIDFQRGR